jgi:hypothetical protein
MSIEDGMTKAERAAYDEELPDLLGDARKALRASEEKARLEFVARDQRMRAELAESKAARLQAALDLALTKLSAAEKECRRLDDVAKRMERELDRYMGEAEG